MVDQAVGVGETTTHSATPRKAKAALSRLARFAAVISNRRINAIMSTQRMLPINGSLSRSSVNSKLPTLTKATHTARKAVATVFQ